MMRTLSRALARGAISLRLPSSSKSSVVFSRRSKSPVRLGARLTWVRRMQDSITVTVPARLHLGFLDLNGELGRTFGSIGLALSGLRTRVTVSRAMHAQVIGPDSDRVRRHVETLSDALGLRGAHRVQIDKAIPAHAGLGSGTQLALALAAAMRKLHGLPLDIRGDAMRLGRGGRSGIGIGLFDAGGVVVDGGRGPANGVAPV